MTGATLQGWKRLRHVTAIKGGAGFPHEEQGLLGDELPFYKVGDLERAAPDGGLTDPEHTVSRATAKKLGAYVFQPGTVVFAKVGAALMLNRFRQLRSEACLDNNMMGLEPFSGAVTQRFLKYAMETKDLSLISNPGAVPSVNASQIAEERIWCPGPAVQVRIANFLDEQTARIDALIAAKEALRDRVQEYELAEISRLVRTGVRGLAQVSTSRELIPEAPKGWRVTSLKRALSAIEQGWSPQCENRPADAGEWGVLKVGCVNGASFNSNENKALPPSLEPDLTCVLEQGDVLMSRANTRELVGMAALVDSEFPNLLLCDKLYRLKLRADWLNAEFAVSLLRCDYVRRQIELGASGASSSMQNISQDVVRGLNVALPPLDEQLEIVATAARVRSACNALAVHVAEHIDRLREYRSSLISAAVTGQLDLGDSCTWREEQLAA